jgi:hypothetical protein
LLLRRFGNVVMGGHYLQMILLEPSQSYGEVVRVRLKMHVEHLGRDTRYLSQAAAELAMSGKEASMIEWHQSEAVLQVYVERNCIPRQRLERFGSNRISCR